MVTAMLDAKTSLRTQPLSCVPVFSFGADLSALEAMLEYEHKAQRPSNAISQYYNPSLHTHTHSHTHTAFQNVDV